jgi:hypothetical protein
LERREKRRARARRLSKWVPALKAICRKYGIEAKDISGGHQFRAREYIINWWPSSNKITIQYAGSGENRRFEPELVPDEPKIVTAIKKLVRVVKGEDPSTDSHSPSASER